MNRDLFLKLARRARARKLARLARTHGKNRTWRAPEVLPVNASPAAQALLFETLEPRVLLSADHNVFAATVSPAPATQAQLGVAPTVSVATTTQATSLDTLVKPAAAASATVPTVPGSQMQETTHTGTLSNVNNNTDTFTVSNVAYGNTLSLLFQPSSPDLQANITVTNPAGVAWAGRAGSGVLSIPPIPAYVAGDYTVTVASTSGSGDYTATVGINTVLNLDPSTPDPNTGYSITDLTPSASYVVGDGQRMGAVGHLFTPNGADYQTVDGYDVTVQKGDVLDISAIATSTSDRGVTIDVYDQTGTLIAIGADNPTGSGQSIDNLVAPADGTYTINVFALDQTDVDYNLVVTQNAGFKIASSPDSQLSSSGSGIGHLNDVSPAGPINVAVEGGDGAQAIANQLNGDTQFNFNATVISADQVTAGDLNGYDAVILADTPSDLPDQNAFDQSIEAFQRAGGGVVTLPTSIYTGSSFLPVADVGTANETDQTVTFSGTSPITAGLTTLDDLPQVETSQSLNGDGTALATTPDGTVVVAALQPDIANNSAAGRSVFLGLPYEDPNASTDDNSGVRTGAEDQLLQQAVAWAATKPDTYLVNLSAGDSFNVEVSVPGQNEDGSADGVQPEIMLLAPDGTIAGVALNYYDETDLSAQAPVSGTYRLVVAAENDTSGDYELYTSGATGARTAPSVSLWDPYTGEILTDTPSQVTLHFSEPLIEGTLSASSVSVNGVAATSIVEHGSQYYDFLFDPSAVNVNGANVVTVAAGAATGVDGLQTQGYTGYFGVGTIAPTSVTSSSLAEHGVVAAGTVTETITFSQPVSVADLSSATLTNTTTGTIYKPQSIDFDPTTDKATFTYAALPQTTANAMSFVLSDDSVHDVFGNLITNGLSIDFTVGTPGPQAVPLTSVGPAGAGIFAGNSSGAFSGLGTNDQYTFTAIPGQTFSAALSTDPTQTVRLDLTDGTGSVVASTTASGLVSLANVVLAAGGEYTLSATSVADAGSGQGATFAVGLALNAKIDSAEGTNTSLVSATNLDGSSLPAGSGDRLAVVGAIDSAGDAKTYTFSLSAGQPSDIVVSSPNGANPTFKVYDADGNLVAQSSADAVGNAVVQGLTASAATTFTVEISGTAGAAYALAITRGAQIATAPATGLQGIDTGAILAGLGDAGGTGPIRIGIYAGSQYQSYPQPSDLASLLESDPEYDVQAQVVTASDIDTVAKLQSFDVILLANRDDLGSYATFAGALQQWVESGGSVVAAGSFISYSTDQAVVNSEGDTLASLNAILPVTMSPTVATSGDIAESYNTATASPITANLPSLPNKVSILAAPVDPGASTLVSATGLLNQSDAIVSLNQIGQGRGIYIAFQNVLNSNGGMSSASESVTASADSGSGSTPSSSLQLLEQALAYAADVGDVFSLQATAGQTLTLSTTTENVGEATPATALTPTLTLIGPDGAIVATNSNGAANGTDAALTFTPSLSGTYRVEVTGTGAGQFVLNVTGASAAPPAFTAAAVDPVADAYVQNANTIFELTFSSAIDLRTLSAADLTIDGQSAIGVTVVDGRTVEFDTGTLLSAQGTHTIALAAGSVIDVAGTALSGFSTQLTVDTTPPTVIGTSVDGGTASPANPFAVSVTFSEAIDPASLQTYGAYIDLTTASNYLYASAVSYDAATYTAIYTFTPTTSTSSANPTIEGSYEFVLNGNVYDLAGNSLIGDQGQYTGVVRQFSIDDVSEPLPPLVAAAPAGSEIFSAVQSGNLYGTGDVDQYTLNLPKGDTAGVLLALGASGATASIDLVDSNGTTVATAATDSAGNALITTSPVLAGGSYSLRVTSITGAGNYSLQVVTNALLDAAASGPTSIEPTAQAVTGGARLAAEGTLGASGEDDYTFTLAAGETASLGLGYPAFSSGSSETADLKLTLIDPNGNVVASGASATELAQAVGNYAATLAGTYTVKVVGDVGTTYNLVITRGLGLFANAGQALTVGSSALGGLSSISGTSRPLRVLVYGNATVSASDAEQLNSGTYGNFSASAAAFGSITSSTQLQNYDVVVLDARESDVTDPAFAAALRDWVQNDGGGLVALSSTIYWAGATDPNMEAVLPINTSTGTDTGEGELIVNIPDQANPVVTGVSFPYGFSYDYSYAPVAAGATGLALNATNTGQAIVASESVGLGRSVFIGSDNTQLLQQAALYAGTTGTAENYALTLAGGEGVTITTSTPVGGGGSGSNALQPTLQLVAPDGTIVASETANEGDGQNAALSFMPGLDAGGTYTLRVLNEGANAGAYVVSATAGGGTAIGTASVQPTTVTSFSSFTVDQPQQIAWTVTNNGSAAATGPWTSDVYISATPTLGSSAVLLGSATNSGSLGIGQQFKDQINAILPSTLASGTYYILVKTTGPDTSSATQTIASAAVTVTSDLTLALAGPSEVLAGQTGSFGVTFTNTTDAALNGQYYDYNGGYFGAELYLTQNPNDPTSGTSIGTIVLGAASLDPHQSATATANLTIPSLPDGTYYLAAEVYGYKDGTLSLTRVALASATIQVDHVKVSAVTAPAAANSGTPATISWTLTNPSETTAVTQQITDYVYVTSDAAGDNPVLAGTFTYTGGLAPGQTLTRIQSVTPPALDPGSYYFSVTSSVDSYPSTNSTAVAPTATAFGQAAPNLVVSSITPPSALASSQPVTITWTTQNIGTAPTGGAPWVDQVYLSASQDLTANSILLGTVNNPAALDVGQSYQSSVTATLPDGISGAYYVVVVADATNQIFENINEDDNSTAVPVTVTLTPPPDLQVTTVSGPATAFSGTTGSVSWTVTNTGQGPTTGTTWSDDVYISTSPTLDSTATRLGTFEHDGALASGAHYTTSQNVTLPVGISGSYYFIVQTNVGLQVYEGANGANDVTATATASNILLTPPPDLTATITAAPTTGAAGGAVTLSYVVSNDGATLTPNSNWVDTVYVSKNPTLDSSAVAIGSVTHYGALLPGADYDTTETYTLPNGISGAYYILVDTDTAGQVFETDKTNNVDASSISVTSDPPSFAVTSLTAPNTAATGQPITVSYTVVNNGGSTLPVVDTNGVIIQEGFTDLLLLTGTDQAGQTTTTVVGKFVREGLIAAGGTYSDTEVVTLPYIPTGPYTLSLVAGSDIYQATGPNHTASQSFTLTQAAPDLAVTNVSAPATLEAGIPTTITWTTQNIGTNPTDSNYWYDNVYVSTKPTLDGSATLLGSYRQSSALAPGAAYAGSLSTSLPAGLAAGSYYVLVETDAPSGVLALTRVSDGNRSNNVGASSAVSVTANPNGNDKPDLAVTSITANAQATSGQTINVSWTVKNVGSAPADLTGFDTVYLSLDGTLDKSSDVYLGSYLPDDGFHPTLAAGASYTASANFKVPAGLNGTYYVFVDTDAGNTNTSDPDKANNVLISTGQTTVSPPVPVDLSIDAGSITIPDTGTAGAPASFTYTVSNQSTNNAVGSWTDTLYLSKTGTFDPSDLLLGSVVHEGGLAAGDSYQATLNTILPGVTPGAYHVIVRTNILDNVPETTLANNIAASVNTTSIDMPALTAGTPVTGTLSAGESLYYKVTVPAGEALGVTLDTTSGNPNASSAVYVKYGSAPTANSNDFSAAEPFTGSQTVTVPTTQAGTYYIEVVGENAVGAFSLLAQPVPFSISSVETTIVGNAGTSTLKVSGALFTAATAFGLVGADGTVLQATAIDRVDASTAYVSFGLLGATAQAYTLLASDNGQTTAAGMPVDVIEGQGFVLSLDGDMPSAVRVDKPATFTVTYGNTGDQDMLAPLLIVTPSDDTVSMGIGDDQLRTGPLFVLGASTDGPSDTLRPGETQAIGVTFATSIGNHYHYSIGYTGYVSTDTGYDLTDQDWTTIEAAVRPDGLTDAQWNSFFDHIKPSLGDNWGDLDKNLNTIMTEVSLPGAPIRDVRALFAAMYAVSPTFNPFPSLSGDAAQCE